MKTDMIALQPIAGLYELIRRKRNGAAWVREHANETPEDAEAKALEMEAEAERLEARARADVAVINTAELLIHDLATSSHQSAYRTLAMRALQEASGWLRRELGTCLRRKTERRKTQEKRGENFEHRTSNIQRITNNF